MHNIYIMKAYTSSKYVILVNGFPGMSNAYYALKLFLLIIFKYWK
jgi:hypothetical protein